MANGLGGLIDDQSFDDVYHTTKFLEDVSMLMSVEIGRCEMTVRDVLALKVGSLVEFSKVVGEPMDVIIACLLYTSPSPRDISRSRMPSSA